MRYADAPALPPALSPFPCAPGTKRPAISGWRDADLSALAVARLAAQHPECGIGARLGTRIEGGSPCGFAHPIPPGMVAWTAALDVDVTDPALVAALMPDLDLVLGVAPLRFGARPKFARLLQVISPEPPAPRSVWFKGGDGVEHKIELLTRALMLHGQHPSAGEYVWEPELTDPGPPVLPADIDAAFAAIRAFLSEAGLEITRLVGGEGDAARGVPGDPDDALANYTPPANVSDDELREALARVDPDLPYPDWVAVGMALHHQYHGQPEGLTMWDAWSANGTKYPGFGALADKWETFECLPGGRPRTARYIFQLARIERRAEQVRRRQERRDVQRGNPADILPDLEMRVLRNGALGDPQASLLNVLAVLTRDVAFPALHHDERTETNYWGDETAQDHHALILKRHMAENYQVEPSAATCNEAITIVCRDNATHPVQEYFLGLTWDGIPRVDRWLHRSLGAPDTDFYAEIAQRMLMSVLARTFEPGCKWDYVVVLEGAQRTGKSSTVHKLLPDPTWTADLEFSRDERRMQDALAGAVLVELGELRGLNFTDNRSVKAFVSRTYDTYRRAYARQAQAFPRACVFIGTTNDRQYLTDETGNRRFIPVPVIGGDPIYLDQNRDQLWAEAMTLYRADPAPLVWREETLAVMAEHQAERLNQDDWQDAIEQYLRTPAALEAKGLPGAVIALEALNISIDRYGRREQHRIADIMRRLGWQSGSFRDSTGTIRRGYLPESPRAA